MRPKLAPLAVCATLVGAVASAQSLPPGSSATTVSYASSPNLAFGGAAGHR
jgi:hypothetical protein